MTQVRSLDAIWKDLFGLSFWEFCEAVPKDVPTYIIMDEAQTWYPANVEGRHAKSELDSFWSGAKIRFKPMEVPDHAGTTESSPVTVRLLYLAGYGESKLGVAATPLEFMDPLDPATQQRLPLGLNVLRLDRNKTDELITKVVNINNSQGKVIIFP